MDLGKKVWVFGDGDLPPQGSEEPLGHEALMVVNYADEDAILDLEFLFEDVEPVTGVRLKVCAKRVKCFRLDYPIGDTDYSIPFGQYAMIVKSNVPVVALFGRLDRRKDMAYYSPAGYSE